MILVVPVGTVLPRSKWVETQWQCLPLKKYRYDDKSVPFLYYCDVFRLDVPPARVNLARTAVAPTDHSNRMNKAIHLLFVWPILWTGLALLASFFPLGSLPPGVLEHLPFRDVAWNLHLGTPLTLAYVFVYLGEQPSAAGL